jgi:hypothetical protein
MCVNVVFEARPHGERGGPSILIPTKKVQLKTHFFLDWNKKDRDGDCVLRYSQPYLVV